MKSHIKAERMVKQFAMGSLSSLLVPSLLAEWVLLPAIQLTLIHRLCAIYGQKFVINAAKAKIAIFLSWLVMLSASNPVGLALQHIPLIGSNWQRISTALIGSASTYAIGKVFILHFEAGGTLLNLDPEKLRSYYVEQFEKERKAHRHLVYAGKIR